MDKDLKKDTTIERQVFQMHKKGYNDIVEAISNIKITVPAVEVNIPEILKLEQIDMSDTNKILLAMVDKMNEPLCVKLILK